MSMDYVRVEALTSLWEVFDEIRSNPFQKVEGGYQYALDLLTGEGARTKTSLLLKGTYDDELARRYDRADETREKVNDLLAALSKLMLSDKEFSTWTMFRRESGSVASYFELLKGFYEYVITLSFELGAIGPRDGGNVYETENDKYERCDALRYDGSSICFRNLNRHFEETCRAKQGAREAVLNSRNPFADISICEQQFVYGSPDGFESLSLSTSHVLTKADKGDDTSCFVLQPGFKVKRLRVGQDNQSQAVLFDDTLTTEITKNAESIYVYVN